MALKRVDLLNTAVYWAFIFICTDTTIIGECRYYVESMPSDIECHGIREWTSENKREHLTIQCTHIYRTRLNVSYFLEKTMEH